MNPAIWVGIFLPLFVILMQRRERKYHWAARRAVLSQKMERDFQMVELAKRMIGKECIIYLMDNQVTGTIREVTDGAILLSNGKDTDVVNLSFVMRIREYPVGKNGKKKSLILD